MRPFHPDYRSRQENFYDLERSRLRTIMYKVTNDLNPWKPEIAKYIELRIHYSPSPAEFAKQALIELQKAEMYHRYLDAAIAEMQKIDRERQQETQVRWRANYDLMMAQLLAYRARLYEYGAYMTGFMKEPKPVPLTKPPDLRLARWDVQGRKQTITGSKTASDIDRSRYLFESIIRDYPGTPWAARAQWELGRGFGVELQEIYHGPPGPPPPPHPVVQIPKL